PGSIASVFGAYGRTPDHLTVGGMDAVITGDTPSQVNFIVPDSLPPGRVTVSVQSDSREVATGQVTITPAGPGIFVLNGADPAQPGAIENQDFAINSPTVPAAHGSVIQIFATGYGALDGSGAAPVQVFMGDTPAQVLYSAPVQGHHGLW